MTSAQLDELTKDYPADLKERAVEFNDIINGICDNGSQARLYGMDTEFKTLMNEIGGMDRVKRGVTQDLPNDSPLREWGMESFFGDYGQLGCCLKDEERAKMKLVNSRMAILLAGRIQQFDRHCQDDPAFAEICSVVKANIESDLRVKFTDKSGNTKAVELRAVDGGNMAADMKMFALMGKECGDNSAQLCLEHYKHAFKIFSPHIVTIIGTDGRQAAATSMLYATIYMAAKMPQASEDVPCLTEPSVSAAPNPNGSTSPGDVSDNGPQARGDISIVRKPTLRHHRTLSRRLRIQATNSWRRIIRHEQSRKREVEKIDKTIAYHVQVVKDPAAHEMSRSASWTLLPILAQNRREAVAKLWKTRLGEGAKNLLILPIVLIGVVLVALLLASSRSDKRN